MARARETPLMGFLACFLRPSDIVAVIYLVNKQLTLLSWKCLCDRHLHYFYILFRWSFATIDFCGSCFPPRPADCRILFGDLRGITDLCEIQGGTTVTVPLRSCQFLRVTWHLLSTTPEHEIARFS